MSGTAKPKTDKELALEAVEKFKRRRKHKSFIYMSRTKVAEGLLERIADPNSIDQGDATVCVPASHLRILAIDRPLVYAQLVIDLFEHGRGYYRKWELNPCKDLREYQLPSTARVPQCDWIPCASMRDSGNWFIDFESIEDKGGTDASESVSWLKKAGYTIVKKNYNSSKQNLQLASQRVTEKYHVMLSINSEVLPMCTNKFIKQEVRECSAPSPADSALTSKHSNHRVVLASPISFGGDDTVSMRIFSWGKVFDFRQLALSTFLRYYFGYIACKG